MSIEIKQKIKEVADDFGNRGLAGPGAVFILKVDLWHKRRDQESERLSELRSSAMERFFFISSTLCLFLRPLYHKKSVIQ